MNAIQQLSRDEGRKHCVYRDHLGFWTVGVGFLVDDRKPGAGLRDEEIDFILANRVALIESDLSRRYPWFVLLNEARRGALVNMAFQLGVTGLAGFRNMLTAIGEKRWADAERHALDSKWAQQDTPERARRVARQIRTGEWQ